MTAFFFGQRQSGQRQDCGDDAQRAFSRSGIAQASLADDEIAKIMYEGDPAPLTQGREFALEMVNGNRCHRIKEGGNR